MKVNQADDFELKILNILGQEVFSEELKQFTGTYKKQLNLKECGKGMYELHIINSDAVFSRKVIIK